MQCFVQFCLWEILAEALGLTARLAGFMCRAWSSRIWTSCAPWGECSQFAVAAGTESQEGVVLDPQETQPAHPISLGNDPSASDRSSCFASVVSAGSSFLSAAKASAQAFVSILLAPLLSPSSPSSAAVFGILPSPIGPERELAALGLSRSIRGDILAFRITWIELRRVSWMSYVPYWLLVNIEVTKLEKITYVQSCIVLSCTTFESSSTLV